MRPRFRRTPLARFLQHLLLVHAVVLAATAPALAQRAQSAPPPPGDEEQQGRQRPRERFRLDYSDSSGLVRQDLWQKGLDHVSHMSTTKSTRGLFGIFRTVKDPPAPAEKR